MSSWVLLVAMVVVNVALFVCLDLVAVKDVMLGKLEYGTEEDDAEDTTEDIVEGVVEDAVADNVATSGPTIVDTTGRGLVMEAMSRDKKSSVKFLMGMRESSL